MSWERQSGKRERTERERGGWCCGQDFRQWRAWHMGENKDQWASSFMGKVENGLRWGWKSRQWAFYAGLSRDLGEFHRKNCGLNSVIKAYKGRECFGLSHFFKDYWGILWAEGFCEGRLEWNGYVGGSLWWSRQEWWWFGLGGASGNGYVWYLFGKSTLLWKIL